MAKIFLNVMVACLILIDGAFASISGPPATFMYQGRIVSSRGEPLEHQAVSFEFSILSPSGTCTLYREQVSNLDMRNSKGIFEVAIGTGSKSFPSATTFSLLDAFTNSETLNCDGGTTYSPVAGDGRILRVQFYDGTGWRLISPDSVIRSVPFAAFALGAQKLGANVASDFILKTAVPTCATGQVITFNGTNFSCVVDASGGGGGGSGTVTNITAGTGLTGGPITTTGTLAVDVGVGANQIVQLNGSSQLPAVSGANLTNLNASNLGSGTVGAARMPALTGDVTTSAGAVATTIAANAITSAKINDGAVGVADLDFAGTMATNMGIVVRNGTQFYNKTCSGNEVLIWTVANGWSCSSINAALGYTAIPEARTITAGTGLTGGGDLSANRTLAVNVGVGANQIPQLDGSGKLNASVLPASASSPWGVSGSNIYYNSGNVGIGTASPVGIFDVRAGTAVAGASGSNITLYAQNGGTGMTNGGHIVLMPGVESAGGNPGGVGIGTTTPSAPLHIESRLGNRNYPMMIARENNSYAQLIAFRPAGTQTAANPVWNIGVLGSSADLTILTDVSGTTTRRVVVQNTTGNVGIGTTSPSAKLEVGGQVKITGGTPGAGKVLTSDAVGLATWETPSSGGATPAGANTQIQFNNSGALGANSKFVWDNTNGRLGVGTASPTGPLQVTANSTSASFVTLENLNSTSTSADSVLSIRSTSGGGEPYIEMLGAGAVWTMGSDRDESGNFKISTSMFPSPGTGDVLTLDTSGNVGIGVTPTAKLQVAGQIKITGGTPGAGKVLTSDASGLATWQTPAAGGSGTVTSVASGTGLTGGPITTTGTLAVDVGTGANKIVQLNASSQLPAVSGVNLTALNASNLGSGTVAAARMPALTGDVTTSAGAVATTIANNAVTSAKINDGTVSVADLNFAGTMATNTGIVVRDGTQFYNKTCSGNEALIWTVANGWSCSAVVLSESDPQVGGNTTNYLSKWNGSALVASTVYDSGTKVGIGTASPNSLLDIQGSGSSATFSLVNTNNSSGIGATMYIENYGTSGQPTLQMNFHRGVAGAPTAVQQYDWIGVLQFQGYGASAYAGRASIVAVAEQNFTNANGGTSLQFKTTALNANVETERMKITPAGDVGIGTSTPSEKLHVAGNVIADSYVQTSDRRLKSNIQDINGLDLIRRLRGVKYIRNSTGQWEYGVIAQEVEEVAPELVVTNKYTGIKAVQYQNLVSPLIEAVKASDLQCRMATEDLKKQVQGLQAELAQTKKDVQEMKIILRKLASEKE